jgi:hypothetical protein
MKDLIRSPLQFVRPMTEQEWRELVLRETHREARRVRRQRARQQLKLVTPPLVSGRLRSKGVSQVADPFGVF